VGAAGASVGYAGGAGESVGGAAGRRGSGYALAAGSLPSWASSYFPASPFPAFVPTSPLPHFPAGLAVIKVLVFDLASLDALYRVGSVFILGLVFLLAYLYHRQGRSNAPQPKETPS